MDIDNEFSLRLISTANSYEEQFTMDSVFISFSFKDEGQYHNIADQLKSEKIPYYRKDDLIPGSSLADQLREIIQKSPVCVFIATHNSIDSAWCGAELGAFWGAGKPVIIYVADSSLESSELPKQFHGHLSESRIKNVVKAVKLRLDMVDRDAAGGRSGILVSDLPADEFGRLRWSKADRDSAGGSLGIQVPRKEVGGLNVQSTKAGRREIAQEHPFSYGGYYRHSKGHFSYSNQF